MVTVTDSYDMVSRRQALAGLGSVGAGALGVVTLGTQTADAQAQIDVQELSIPDATHEAPGGEVYSPWLSIAAEWAFEGVDAADGVEVALLADGSILTTQAATASGPADSGTTDVAAPLVEARSYDSEDWTVPENSSAVSRTVDVELILQVNDSSGETLENASAATTVQITIQDGGPATVTAVGGSGEVLFQEQKGDEPPA